MRDEEIKKLAKEISEKMYSQFGNPESVDMMAEEFEVVLKIISETHCIVEKEKIKESYRQHKEWFDRFANSDYDERFDQCREEGAMTELESIFGTDLFKEK